MGIAAPRAVELDGAILGQAEFGGVQRVLAGKYQSGMDSARVKRIRDGGQLYRFGAGTDCDRDLGRQPSP